MATLTSTKIKNTYDALLKATDNDAIGSSAKQITDGLGNGTPLYISTTQIGIGVTPEATYDLHVYSNAKVGGNLTVTGDLTVDGTVTTVSSETLTVTDPLIELAKDNTSTDALDIGFYGKYAPSGTTLYAGLFRDTGDSKFKLFRNLQEQPTTTVNTSGTGYTKADLVLGDLDAQNVDVTSILTTSQFTASSHIILTAAGSDTVINGIKQQNSNRYFNFQLGASGGLKSFIYDGVNPSINWLSVDTSGNATFSDNIIVSGTGSFTGQVTIPLNPSVSTDAASKGYVDSQITAQDLDFSGDSGTGSIDLDSQTLSIIGGTLITTTALNQNLDIDHNSVSRTDTTSSASPAFGGTFTAVDSVTSSAEGHITAINLKTVTVPTPTYPAVNNNTITINAGSNLDTGGAFTLNQSFDETITIDLATTITGLTSVSSTTFSGQLDGTISSTTTATTQTQGDNSTKVATTAYVDSAIGGQDTLAEILANGNTTGGTDISVSSGDNITLAAGSKVQYSTNSFMTPENNVTGAEISTAGDFRVKTGTTPSLALILGGTQNATFYGNIDINGNNKHIRFIDTYGNWLIEAGDGANNFKIHSQSLGADYLTLEGGGQLNLGEYGSGTFTGTATYRLAVDSSGDVIEIPIGGGAVDGSGTANTVTMWSDTDTITNAPITISGNNATFAGNVTTGGQVTVPSGYSVNIGTSRIHSTDTSYLLGGNVGIGTTLPSAKLDVQSSGAWGQYGRGATADINVENTNTSVTEGGWIGISGYTGNAANSGYYPMAGITAKKSTTAGDGNYGGDLSFWTTAGTGQSGEANSGMYQRMTINRFGNVGIGETPSSWSAFTVLQVEKASLASTGGDMNLMSNSYYDGTAYKYIGSGAAARQYYNTDGTMHFYNASSGTAGGTVTWNERMRIDSSGNVGINETSPSSYFSPDLVVKAKADLGGITIRSNATSHNNYLMFADGTTGNERYRGYVNYNHSADSMTFGSAAVARMTIDSSGNVQIKTSGAELFFNDNGQIRCADDNHRIRFRRSENILELVEYGDIIMSTGATPTERMRIDSSGKVLINQTSSATDAKLQVDGGIDMTGSAPTAIRLYDGVTFKGGLGDGQWAFGSTSYANDYALYAQNDLLFHAGTGSSIDMMIDGATHRVGIGTDSPSEKLTVDGNLKVLKGDDARIYINDVGDSSTILLRSDGSNTSIGTDSNHDLQIHTNGGERMRINSSGNVGIGVTPNASYSNLQIKTPSSAYSLDLVGRDAGSNSESQITFWNAAQSSVLAAIYNSTSNLYFYTNGDNRMIINSSGNVGIGTTSPSTSLTIERATNSDEPSLYLDTAGGGSGSVGMGNSSAIGPFLVGNTNPDGTVRGAYGGSRMLFNAGGFSFQYSSQTSGTRTFDTKMVINSGGSVGIGETNPTYRLNVKSSNNLMHVQDTSGTSNATFVLFSAPSITPIGGIYRNGSAGSIVYSTSSDYRLKEDLQDFNALDLVDNITAYDYKWKDTEQRDYGFVAHELQEVMPNVVTGEKDGEMMQGVDYAKLTPVLLKAIQELKAEIETLKAQINN